MSLDFSKLDPRFKAVSVGSCFVLELSGASAAAPKAAARSEGPAKAGKAAEPKAKKAAAPSDGAAAEAVLGPDGKPLSKKELRILERQKREVGSGIALLWLVRMCGVKCCSCLAPC